MWWRAPDSARQTCWRLPGLASDENLAGVHDAAGQAGRVDGAQRRAELDDVGPDQGLGEQARVLPGGRGFVLTCTPVKRSQFKRHFCNKPQNVMRFLGTLFTSSDMFQSLNCFHPQIAELIINNIRERISKKRSLTLKTCHKIH